MALLDFLGFNHYATSSIDVRVLPNWILSDVGGFFSKVSSQSASYSACQGGSNPANLQFNMSANHASLIVGFRFKTSTAFTGTTSNELVRFRDGTTTQIGLAINGTSKKLFLFKNTTGTTVATGTTTLLADSWYYAELKVVFGTTGSYELKLGGVTEVSSGSADTTQTANDYATNVLFDVYNSVSNSMKIIADIYICDTTGSAPHNDFLGMVIVDTLFPTTDNSVQFTPLSSTNASNVDETTVDDDTTYNSSSTSTHVDTFNHGALPVTPTTIFAAKITHKARKDDVAARSSRNKLISGGTTSSGTSVALSTSYQYLPDIYTQNPDTSTAWTKTTIDATKIGYEHV
jgi:hypothetical protein